MENEVISHFRDRQKDYTVNRIQFNLPEFVESSTLIEFGCGAVPVGNHSSTYIGVDMVPEYLKFLRKNNEDYHTILADAKNPPIRNKVIDTVALNALLHHLIGKNREECFEQQNQFFRSMNMIIRKKSKIYIRELIARTAFYSWLMYATTKTFSNFNKIILFPKRYKITVTNFLTEKKISEIAKKNNLKIVNSNNNEWKILLFKLGEKKWYILKPI